MNFKGKIVSHVCRVWLEQTNVGMISSSKEMSAFVAPLSQSTQSMISGGIFHMGGLSLTHGGQCNGPEVLGTEHTQTLSTWLSFLQLHTRVCSVHTQTLYTRLSFLHLHMRVWELSIHKLCLPDSLFSTYTREPGNEANGTAGSKLQDRISQLHVVVQQYRQSHPQTPFFAPTGRMGLLNCLFHFRSSVPECLRIVFFLIQCLTSSKIAFHTTFQLSLAKWS